MWLRVRLSRIWHSLAFIHLPVFGEIRCLRLQPCGERRILYKKGESGLERHKGWPIRAKKEKRMWGPTVGPMGRVIHVKATTDRHKAWKGNHNSAEGLEHHKYRVALSKDYGQEDKYVVWKENIVFNTYISVHSFSIMITPTAQIWAKIMRLLTDIIENRKTGEWHSN
jgi:hypothetical protein